MPVAWVDGRYLSFVNISFIWPHSAAAKMISHWPNVYEYEPYYLSGSILLAAANGKAKKLYSHVLSLKQ